jgi:hypothetical protein
VGRHLLLIPRLAALALIAGLGGLGGCAVEDATSAPRKADAWPEADAALPRLAAAAHAQAATPGDAPENLHADVACAACHDGALPPGRGTPIATTAACLACHEDGGPAEVQVTATSVLSMHATHPGLPGQARMECAQCHTHLAGEAPLDADINGCGLCHADQLDAEPAGECTTCHVAPVQQPLTSQLLAVPHADVPWIEGGCVRCHFAVAPTPDVTSATEDCTLCHTPGSAAAEAWPVDAVTGRPPADSIHGGHRRVACGSCHTANSHRIEGMSSAVGLVCADCHAVSHDLPSREVSAGVCVSCHTETHAPQQGLLLGLVPWDPDRVRPSVKFAAGIACRACHGVAEVDAETAEVSRAGDAGRCVSCHLPEYRTVADWWVEGGEERVAVVREWVESAAPGADPDSVAAARERIAFVETGGLVHGPRLADELLREAVGLVLRNPSDPPRAPDLGSPLRDGLCSYCHVDLDGSWSLDKMPDDFHRDALGRRAAIR